MRGSRSGHVLGGSIQISRYAARVALLATVLSVTKPARIAPSILAADFYRLGEEVAKVEAHVEILHIDVMDGHFVPNITFGIPVLESLRPHSSLRFDCHMMTMNPHCFFDMLQRSGANSVIVHVEVYPKPTNIAALAQDVGLDFGLALNPATPFKAVAPFLELCDSLLVMAVEPGFGGQVFMESSLPKVAEARRFIDLHGLTTDVQVDGGVDIDNIRKIRDTGADVLIAGSSVFRADDSVAAISAMRDEIGAINRR